MLSSPKEKVIDREFVNLEFLILKRMKIVCSDLIILQKSNCPFYLQTHENKGLERKTGGKLDTILQCSGGIL